MNQNVLETKSPRAGSEQLPRIFICVLALSIVTFLVIATASNSDSAIALRSTRSVDGLVIRLPQRWPIKNGLSCSIGESAVLINVPANWEDVQCPNPGDAFATTIRIGHFSIKSGCCVSKITSEIGGISATELRFSNGLIYGIQWTSPQVSIEFECSPYGHLSKKELTTDDAIIHEIVASIHVS